MHPQADQLWRAPRWALAALLALLGMLGPFSIDTYLPAFSGIADALGATPVQMQQTLSAYLFGFAFMNLFHGAMADSFGRRPVVLWGIAMFTLASAGCALAQTIEQLVFFRALQGLSTGAGIVVSRAVIRDMYAPAQAQKVMAQVTIYFGVAPAIAPIVGGWLFVHTGWHSIFWFLTGVGVVLWTANYRLLPETLHDAPEGRRTCVLVDHPFGEAFEVRIVEIPAAVEQVIENVRQQRITYLDLDPLRALVRCVLEVEESGRAGKARAAAKRQLRSTWPCNTACASPTTR